MSGGYRAGAPPGDDAGVGANRPRNVERPPSGSDVARVPACPYCSIVYVRVNRRARRRLTQLGKQPGEWMATHRDDCPMVTLGKKSGLQGWQVVGLHRSVTRGAS